MYWWLRQFALKALPLQKKNSSDFCRQERKILSRTSTRSDDSRTFSSLKRRTLWPFKKRKKSGLLRNQNRLTTGHKRTNHEIRKIKCPNQISAVIFLGGRALHYWGFFLLCYYLIIWIAFVIDSSRAPMAKQHTRIELSGNLMTLELFRRNGGSMNVCRFHTHISFSLLFYSK